MFGHFRVAHLPPPSMENPEEVLQLLERFTKLKQKEIPRELDDYLGFVARTGDTVYRWAIVKHLFREKLVHVITDFHDNTPSIAGKWESLVLLLLESNHFRLQIFRSVRMWTRSTTSG